MPDKYLAIYLRLSLEDLNTEKSNLKDESNSIQHQRMMINRYIEENSELAAFKTVEFIDDGYTGTNFDRPGFQKMLTMIRQGLIKCIVVKDLSRFGRNYLEVGEYLEHIFPPLQVRFIAITDNYDSNDFSGTTAGLDVAFRNFLHDRYSVDLSAKVKASMHMLMEKGEYVTHCPYGYMKTRGVKHKMVPDPQTAPVVRDIFLMAIKGLKTTEIARNLNRRGILTPMEYKGLSRERFSNPPMWTHQAVLRILQDYKYTGAMVTFKCENLTIRAKAQHRRKPEEYLIIEDVHEAIVSHDEYYAANETIRKVKAFSRTKSDKKDKVYICGICGRRLRKTYGSDEYYSCPTQLYIGGAKCGSIRLKRSEIEKTLFDAYKGHLEILSDEYRRMKNEKKSDEITPLKNKIKSLSVQLKSLDGDSMQYYEKYRAGEMTREGFLAKKQEASDKRISLSSKIQALNDLLEAAVKKKSEAGTMIKTLKEKADFLLLPDEELQAAMYDDIRQVIVYANDLIDIAWKFSIDFNTSGG